MRSSQKKRGSYPQKFPKSSRNTPRPRRRTRKKDPRGCSRCPSHGLSGPCSRHSPSSGTVCLGRVVAMQHLFILPNTHSGCPPLKQPNVSFRSACRLDRRSLVCSREFGLRGRLGSKLQNCRLTKIVGRIPVVVQLLVQSTLSGSRVFKGNLQTLSHVLCPREEFPLNNRPEPRYAFLSPSQRK